MAVKIFISKNQDHLNRDINLELKKNEDMTCVVKVYNKFFYYIKGCYIDDCMKNYTAEDWFNSLSEEDKLEAIWRINEWR